MKRTNEYDSRAYKPTKKYWRFRAISPALNKDSSTESLPPITASADKMSRHKLSGPSYTPEEEIRLIEARKRKEAIRKYASEAQIRHPVHVSESLSKEIEDKWETV